MYLEFSWPQFTNLYINQVNPVSTFVNSFEHKVFGTHFYTLLSTLSLTVLKFKRACSPGVETGCKLRVFFWGGGRASSKLTPSLSVSQNHNWFGRDKFSWVLESFLWLARKIDHLVTISFVVISQEDIQLNRFKCCPWQRLLGLKLSLDSLARIVWV